MDISQKLIITATNANSWIFSDVKNWPDPNKVEELVDDVFKSYQAGASIAHVHPPLGKEKELVKRIREKCDIIIQIGMSSYPIEDRTETFNARPDMMSIILNHHDEHFTQVHVNQLHSLEELEQYTIKCKDSKIKPEWEVWHMGSYWNLQYLIDKKLISPPHVLTLFFNWPGGTWSPPTPDEYLHRLKYIPKKCLYTVSIMGSEQIKIVPLAISHGGNVRVGTEDYPFINTGLPAKNTAELVLKTVKMANQMGREVATPIEARKILGMDK